MVKNNDGGSAKPDNLEAARAIRDALQPFPKDEQERILRWARESVGLSNAPEQAAKRPIESAAAAPIAATPAQTGTSPGDHLGSKDISTFVIEKNPKTDIQFATTLAYYYRFEAPPAERRDEVDAKIVRDGCRLAGHPGRLVHPLTTLNNAHAKGFLDRGSARGKFVINSVGENLVGMALPGVAGGERTKARRRNSKSGRKPGKRSRS